MCTFNKPQNYPAPPRARSGTVDALRRGESPMASARRFILLLVVVWMVASTLRGGSVVLAAVGSTGAVLSGPEHTQRVPAGRNCDFSGQLLTRFPNLQASHKCTELCACATPPWRALSRPCNSWWCLVCCLTLQILTTTI